MCVCTNFYDYIFRFYDKERNEKRSVNVVSKEEAKSSFQLSEEDLRTVKCTYLLMQDGLNSDVVRWASNGIGFVVLSEDSFSRETLPIYFKHSNYSSFVRQVLF
jgi:hypothetical protein